VIAGLVLVALVLTVRFTRLRSPRAGYLLVLVALVWLVVDKEMEGSVVVRVTRTHGLTAADLTGLLVLALGLRQAWPDVVRRLRRARSRV
jgi:hypothetical protein